MRFAELFRKSNITLETVPLWWVLSQRNGPCRMALSCVSETASHPWWFSGQQHFLLCHIRLNTDCTLKWPHDQIREINNKLRGSQRLAWGTKISVTCQLAGGSSSPSWHDNFDCLVSRWFIKLCKSESAHASHYDNMAPELAGYRNNKSLMAWGENGFCESVALNIVYFYIGFFQYFII